VTVQDVLPRDAIPSIDDPAFDSHYFGDADDEVIVVDGDPARAYPVRILSYHEIVNDTVGERPIAVTWCPICWSGAVYDAAVDDRRLTFGVSGKLADDALVLYDRETESEWKQTTGRCLAGEYEGAELVTRPSPMLSYGSFRERYPEGQVLQPPGGTSEAASDGVEPAPIDYDSEPYADYYEREGAGLAAHRGEGGLDRASGVDLAPRERVLGGEQGGDGRALPQLVPILIFLMLALFFGRTLVGDSLPLVTRIAAGVRNVPLERAAQDMEPPLLRYTRRVTALWTGVFLILAGGNLLVL
jgi:hypothetical protein